MIRIAPLNALCGLGLTLGLSLPTNADPWKPAPGKLLTRWAADVSPDKVLPEYPRPQMVRHDWLNLNGLWQYAIAEKEGPPPEGELAGEILVPFPIESALSGVMRRAQRLLYRRTFEVPREWAGKRVLLHFGAVDWEANVYVNGRHQGTHRGGYDAFEFDITDALKPSGPQEVVVGVFDPSDAGGQPHGKQVNRPEGIWYTPTTGIWQTVWLEPVPQARIESLRAVPDLAAGVLRLTVTTTGTNESQQIVAAAAADGKTVCQADGQPDAELVLPMADAKLWSPDSPFLYDLRVTLTSGERTLDEVGSYFGMRQIEVAPIDGVPRLLLNGKALFQMGPLDQGFWPDGLYTAPTDEALKYDIEVMKQLGFNMARKHIKVEPDRWYYWCDKLGLLVWQDMPSNRDKADPEEFESELDRMIAGRGNHPCIVMWVVFNEGWGQYDTERVTALAKGLDPSRLVSNASGWHDHGVGDVVDMHKYPGPGMPAVEGRRAAVLGEYGGLGLYLKDHAWNEGSWSYQGVSGPDQLTYGYISLMRQVDRLRESGLCAAVYTQLTDVETEINGLLTYDRAVIKPDAERLAAAHAGRFPQEKTVLATSREQPAEWHFTLAPPAEGWMGASFDDSQWRVGQGGFGTPETPGSAVRTRWDGKEIWLRREFTLEGPAAHPMFVVHHDEDVEIYVNGILAAEAQGFTVDYGYLAPNAEGAAAMKAGKILLAVHCKQTGGGQYIDVGIVDLVERD